MVPDMQTAIVIVAALIMAPFIIAAIAFLLFVIFGIWSSW